MSTMTFVLSVLIVLLSETRGYEVDDSEIILLPLWNAIDTIEVPLSFKAFGQPVELMLRRNEKLVTSEFEVWKRDGEGIDELAELRKPTPCHYLHRNDISTAAVSLCEENGVRGLVFLENDTLEITPIEGNDISFLDKPYVRKRSEVLGEPHVVKRAHSPVVFPEYGKIYQKKRNELTKAPLATELLAKLGEQRRDTVTLELAMFFDEAGYNLFSPFFERNNEKLRDMLLAYVNAIQAIYHHPSLGINIDISLVRLEIMEKQPRELPHFGGERGRLLDSFCNYAMKKNPPDEDHPNHWDMGLYVSGLDFYAIENGKKNSATMGLATVGGVCIDQYSCVIAELGITNQFGKPFPSAGFTSVYIAAHEIGHNLGMHHDSTGNTCPKDGYIMSPSRGTQGETIWSACSRDVAQKLLYTKPCLLDKPAYQTNPQLNHTKFFDLPGRDWGAKKQCEFLLRDKDASVVTLYKACESLQCKTPHRSGYYFAGPALDGTYCAPGRECRGGECMNALQISSGQNNQHVQPGGWSEWKVGACKSACLLQSKGAQSRRRTCDKPTPKNTETGCQGIHYDVQLCRDDKLCKKKRKTINEFATLRCGDFSERLPELDSKAGGLQAPHEPQRPWMACAIFCRRKDIASYYTPRVELNDLGLDPYFPDGTWCHAEEGGDYFCRQHHCLPENFRFGKTYPKEQEKDIELGPQNASPTMPRLDDQVIKYLSLGPDGLPFLTSLPRGIGFPPNEDEWIDKDYIELTESPEENLLEAQFWRN